MGLATALAPKHPDSALTPPYTPDGLFDALDRIVLEHGGRLYLAKDAMMSADTFARMYPRLDEFRAVKTRVDPGNRFVSSQARRLGIVKEALPQ